LFDEIEEIAQKLNRFRPHRDLKNYKLERKLTIPLHMISGWSIH